MKAICLTAALASSLLLLPVGPASAVVAIQLDLVDGAAVMSDNSFSLIHLSSGEVTVGNRTPKPVDKGQWTTIVVNAGIPVITTENCTIVEVTSECTQATIACTGDPGQHTVIGAIPGSNFKGSIDGVDAKFGLIAVTCVDKTIPAR